MVLKIVVVVVFLLSLPPLVFAHDQPHLIKMVKGGFDPQEVQIDQGETVIFSNEDEQERWPASNIHPTHGIYPEFDPKRPIKPKEEWKFQFNRSGNFRFHDHLIPNLVGSVSVKGDEDPPKQTEINQGLKEKILIFSKKFYYAIFPTRLAQDLKTFNAIETAYKENDLQFWIQVIGGQKYIQKMVADSEGGSKIDCHQEAHLVGRLAYKLEGGSVFKAMDFNCHSGYLHGAMEAFISEQNGRDLTGSVTNLCKEFKTDFSRFECLHGIGHGFMAYMDYDLPKAIDLCRQLEDEYARRSCFGGVFMENILVAEGKGANKGHQTNWISLDPHFPCNEVDQDYLVQYECYQMQTSRMLQISEYDFEFVKKECLNAPSNLVEVCFKSMGRDLAGQTLRDPLKIDSWCHDVPKLYIKECLTGGLNVILEFWGENIAHQAFDLCNRLEGEEKDFCYKHSGGRLKDVFAGNLDKIKKVCDLGQKEYIDICINGTSD